MTLPPLCESLWLGCAFGRTEAATLRIEGSTLPILMLGIFAGGVPFGRKRLGSYGTRGPAKVRPWPVQGAFVMNRRGLPSDSYDSPERIQRGGHSMKGMTRREFIAASAASVVVTQAGLAA